MTLFETDARSYDRGQYHSSGQNNEENVRVTLPKSQADIATTLHEMGHLFRTLEKRKRGLETASIAATVDSFNTNLPAKDRPERKLSHYQTRKIKADEERGAWAFALSVLKEAGNETGIDCGSRQAIDKIKKEAERKLGTYDKRHYSLPNQPENQMIPTFSQEKRISARKLHKEKTEKEIKYGDIPNFDSETGDNIANDPEKISSIISE